MVKTEVFDHYLIVKSIGSNLVTGQVHKAESHRAAANACDYFGNVIVFKAEYGEAFKVEASRNVADSIISAEDILGRPR